jgi:hypothetical protein
MSLKQVIFILVILICTMVLIGFAGNQELTQTAAAIFTGNEDHSITLNEAAMFTFNYRQKVAPDAKIGGFFGKQAIQDILGQENCVGIRYYPGEMKDGTPVLILVGVDKDGNDLYDGLLAERAMPCPPRCSYLNPLNSSVEELTLSTR